MSRIAAKPHAKTPTASPDDSDIEEGGTHSSADSESDGEYEPSDAEDVSIATSDAEVSDNDEPETEEDADEDLIDEDDEYAWVEVTEAYLDIMDMLREEKFASRLKPQDFCDLVNKKSSGQKRTLTAVLDDRGGLLAFEIVEDEE